MCFCLQKCLKAAKYSCVEFYRGKKIEIFSYAILFCKNCTFTVTIPQQYCFINQQETLM